MADQPAVLPAAQRAYDLLAPLTRSDEDTGWLTLTLLAASLRGEEDLWAFVENPGAAEALHPSVAPVGWLPWLARVAGARLTPGMTEAQRRAEVELPDGRLRGKIEKLVAEIEPLLAGARRVTVRENGSAWRLLVITYDAETPDPAAVEKVVEAHDIAGLVITYRTDPGWSIGEMEAVYAGQTIADLEAGFASVGDLETRVPV